MSNYRIMMMAQRRLNRVRLYDKQAIKSLSDAVITHVTQVTVEDAPVTDLEIPENSLQKTQCSYVCALLLVKLILQTGGFVSAEVCVQLFLLQECRYYSHITYWPHTRISL